MLTGKTIVLGITGSIAAYKIANVASALVKLHADVHVIMTKNATNFITPITFETITSNKCIVDTFDRNFQYNVEHIALAKRADIFLIAPASANIIGKLAHGIADDMLSTTVMATKSTVLIAPAMNTNMYTNSIVQDNIEKLKHYGYTFIEPSCGYLACGDIGQGKLPDEALLTEHIISQIAFRKDFIGKRILVTAGPTRERMDPVRYISNHSTGKMGYAIAKMAQRRGAQVTLVSGPTSLPAPLFCNFILVESAAEMFESVTSLAHDQDIIIKAAAVADYRPITIADEKIKKDNKMFTSNIELESTKDILKHLGEHRHSKQILCGFSMETENMIENSKKKLKKKNIDLIAANNLKEKGAGFATDTNRLTLITSDSEETLPMVSKDDAAGLLLDKIYSLIKQ